MPAISVSVGDDAEQALVGARPAQRLLDHERRPRRIGLESLPFVGVIGELHHHVGEQAGRRLTPGDLDLTDDREHLGHTERSALDTVGRRQLGVEQIGEEVVARVVPSILDLGGEVLLLVDDVEFGGDTLVIGDRAPDRGDRRIGPTLELGLPGLGHLEDDRDGAHRQRHGERVEEVDATCAIEAVDQLVADRADRRFELLDPLGRERLRHELAIAGVGRRVLGEHRRHVGPSLGDHLSQPREQLGRRLRGRCAEARRERRRFVQDALDVLVTRHGEDALTRPTELRPVEFEHGRLVAHLAVLGVGTLHHRVVGGIERDGHRAIHSSKMAWKCRGLVSW